MAVGIKIWLRINNVVEKPHLPVVCPLFLSSKVDVVQPFRGSPAKSPAGNRPASFLSKAVEVEGPCVDEAQGSGIRTKPTFFYCSGGHFFFKGQVDKLVALFLHP